MYSRKDQWAPAVRFVLIGLRTLLLFVLFALLLNPLLRRFRETRFPPVSVFLIDNSSSVRLGTPPDTLELLRKNLGSLINELKENGSQVYVTNLDAQTKSDTARTFTLPYSAFEPALLRVSEEFENQNLAQVFLLSDGILNQGSDLSGLSLKVPVHTVRLGNPGTRKDLRIQEVRVNKVAYLGNRFPVSVLVRARQSGTTSVNLLLKQGGRILDRKTLTLGANGLAAHEFKVQPDSRGLKQYQVEVEPVPGEVTIENNIRNVFIEVIDSKQKVLLLASAPHPDIKAIRASLEQLEQIELRTVVGGLDPLPSGDWNLILLHQLPDRSGTFSAQVENILRKQNQSLLLFCGGQTDFNRLKIQASSWINIQGGGNISEEVTGQWNPDFQRYVFEEKWKASLGDLPPLRSPAVSFGWKSPAETILNQKLGRVTVPTPLLSVQTEGSARKGIFWGEGLWLWRINDFAKNGQTEASDNLIRKTVQLLLSAEKKKRLRVFPVAREWGESDPVVFQVETFNALFEPVFDQKIQLQISGNQNFKKEFSFVNARGLSNFRTQGLLPGVYRYKASATLEGKQEFDEGEFIVNKIDLEAQDLEARHDWLKNLSRNTGGKSVGVGDMGTLGSEAQLPKPLVEFADWDENLFHLPWILGLILLFMTAEWIVRKASGRI
jgi:hypothetical protein